MKWEASESSFSTRDPVPRGPGGWQPRRRAVSLRWQRSAPSLGRSRVFAHQRACVCSVWLPPADLAVLCASPCALEKQPRGSAWGRRLLVAPCCSHPQLGAAGCGCTALSSQAVRWDPKKLSPVGAFVQKSEWERDSGRLAGFLLKGLAEFSKPRSEVRLVHGW